MLRKIAYLLSVLVLLYYTENGIAKTLTIDLSSPVGSNSMVVAIAEPFGTVNDTLKKTLLQCLERDIRYIPFLRLSKQYKISYTPNAIVNLDTFSQSNIDLLITSVWTSSESGVYVDIQVLDTLSQVAIVSRRYKVPNEGALQRIADTAMSALLKYLIGDDSLFNTRIFFSQKEGQLKHTLWSIYPNGTGLRKETDIQGVSLSPDVSADGKYIVFTHIDKRRHTLALLDRKTRKIKRIVYPHGTSVISPTFMPSGDIAVALSFKGVPSIYHVSTKTLSREGMLMHDRRINVSPSFSKRDGNLMVYTSNKFGGPQIFMKDMRTGSISRISKEGKYNTDAVFSPDGRYVAYVSMLRQGRRVFLYDTVTRKTKQITFGPGDDDTPAFAPDSYFVSFVSTRNKKVEIFLTTREGSGAVLIPTGGSFLSDPTWGLAN